MVELLAIWRRWSHGVYDLISSRMYHDECIDNRVDMVMLGGSAMALEQAGVTTVRVIENKSHVHALRGLLLLVHVSTLR